MPCYDARDDPNSEVYKSELRAANLRKYGISTTNIEGEVACASMSAHEFGVAPPAFCFTWWREHKAVDAKRRRAPE